MDKAIALISVLVGAVLLVSCSQLQTDKIQPTMPIPITQQPATEKPVEDTVVTYYLLADGSPSFCDGDNMDSVGYKAALTKKVSKTVPGILTTAEEKIRTTLRLAVADAGTFGENYALTADTTFENGIVTMHSANGWAGSSIFYCAWKPFVEKNLEQFPEVKKIKWDTQS